ncbi:MAG TPA: twin-arginine translocase TatA/TatE family subunit [Candidatus Acidoferrum sp.]|nr:twin-arginine translocase TatA/TatE family subunit [Candidatus Acidoferrum sp.]
MLGTTEIALIVGAAVLLFGVDKLPKLARSAGQAKKEFLVGQAEADVAAERARQEARTRAEAGAPAAGTASIADAPTAGTVTAPTTAARPQQD